MGYDKCYFRAPDIKCVQGLGIEKISDVADRLFNIAFKKPEFAEEIFNILSNYEGFEFSKKIESLGDINLDVNIISTILKNEICSKFFKEYAKRCIKNHSRPKYTFNRDNCQIMDVKNIDASLNIENGDFGEKSQGYLALINYSCVLADELPKGEYFITYNALVLSAQATLDSLSSFCRDLDPNDVFAASLKLKSKSKELDGLDSSMSATEYLKALRDIRKSIFVVFGKQVYNNYINIINQAGADPNRYINELLQNADDCEYSGAPRFELVMSADRQEIFIRYNEKGFKKENVRAITAIGESTKKKLRDGEKDAKALIGEKGIGFKTVFGVAEEVHICSGQFNFVLTSNEPTIPKISELKKDVKGTTMTFKLKKEMPADFFTEEKVLKLCLCLRKLKHIKLAEHDITIEDKDGIRTVSINGREYRYKIFEHNFTVNDEDALKVRCDNKREISREQNILFYIPLINKEGNSDYFLYSGLPTEIQIKVPLVIDAPFELDTARTTVLENKWNDVILNAVYDALKALLLMNCHTDGIEVLRFINVKQQDRNCVLDLFSNKELNKERFLSEIKDLKFLSTWGDNVFAKPNDNNLWRIPKFIYLLLERGAITNGLSSYLKCKDTEFSKVLNALGVKELPIKEAFYLVKNVFDEYIEEEAFSKLFYGYLQEKETSISLVGDILKSLKIVPVKGKSPTKTLYFSWNECGRNIYVKDSVDVSTDTYWLLKTQILKKELFERVFNVHINELTDDLEEQTYRKSLKEKINGSIADEELYAYLLNEYRTNYALFKKCQDTLISNKNSIPLKTQLGKFKKGNIYTSIERAGYFEGELIPSHLTCDDCQAFAEFIGCEDIALVHYDGLNISEPLTANDIEVLQDDYFKYGFQILEECISNGWIPLELIEKYSLKGLISVTINDYDKGIFNQPIDNKNRFYERIRERMNSPIKLTARVVERTICVGVNKKGEDVSADNGERRRYVTAKYAPKDGYCVCQMCKKAKSRDYIEVNNIEISPKFYWVECGVCLCLECSKRFERLREMPNVREKFYRAILSSNVDTVEPIEIPIANETITFGQQHLAEIQEILKRQNDLK